MSDISMLKEQNNLKSFHLILLSMVTLGVYNAVWMHKTAVAVENVTRIKTMSTTFLIVYLAMNGFGGLLHQNADLIVKITGTTLLVLAWLVAIAWCFRVRRAIRAYTLTEHHFEIRMNRVFSVLFTFLHINYCINVLPRAKQKHEKKIRHQRRRDEEKGRSARKSPALASAECQGERTV